MDIILRSSKREVCLQTVFWSTSEAKKSREENVSKVNTLQYSKKTYDAYAKTQN